MKTFLAQASGKEGMGSIQQMGFDVGFFIGSHFLEIIIFAMLLVASFFSLNKGKRGPGTFSILKTFRYLS
jgi:hypothetical protein